MFAILHGVVGWRWAKDTGWTYLTITQKEEEQEEQSQKKRRRRNKQTNTLTHTYTHTVNMRIFPVRLSAVKSSMSSLAKMLDFYSGFNPSPLSIKQFMDFGK